MVIVPYVLTLVSQLYMPMGCGLLFLREPAACMSVTKSAQHTIRTDSYDRAGEAHGGGAHRATKRAHLGDSQLFSTVHRLEQN